MGGQLGWMRGITCCLELWEWWAQILAWGEIFTSHQKQERSYFIMSQYISQQCWTPAELILYLQLSETFLISCCISNGSREAFPTMCKPNWNTGAISCFSCALHTAGRPHLQILRLEDRKWTNGLVRIPPAYVLIQCSVKTARDEKIGAPLVFGLSVWSYTQQPAEVRQPQDCHFYPDVIVSLKETHQWRLLNTNRYYDAAMLNRPLHRNHCALLCA